MKVNADKITDILNHFVAIHGEPLFFILELPTKLDDENRMKSNGDKNLHKDIYYIDGLTQEEALTILLRGIKDIVCHCLYNNL